MTPININVHATNDRNVDISESVVDLQAQAASRVDEFESLEKSQLTPSFFELCSLEYTSKATQLARMNRVADGSKSPTTLTADMVRGKNFWDSSKTTGTWKIYNNVLSNKGTVRHNEFNQIVSKQTFDNFNLKVTEEYQYTENHLDADMEWGHARGFSIMYYVNDRQNIEFRYFPDVGQFSLYVNDSNRIQNEWTMWNQFFSPGQSIVHEISIFDGNITWKVNGNLVMNDTTTLCNGRLMLTNHNNAVTFRF